MKRVIRVVSQHDFTTGGKRRIGKDDRVGFTIDGEPYTLVRPKTAVIARIAMVLDQAIPMDDTRNIQRMLSFVAEIIDCVDTVAPTADGLLRGRAHLERRLTDPADELDLEQLLPMFTTMMNGWFDRPTGSPPASTARRPAASRARGSAARTRSTRAKT